MKFLQGASLACLAASSAAATLRQVVISSLKQANTDALALRDAVAGAEEDVDAVIGPAETVIDNLNGSNDLISSTPGGPLNAADVSEISVYVTQLYTDSGALVEALRLRKPDVERSGACSLYTGLGGEITAAASAMIDSITDRVDAASKPMADSVSELIKKRIREAVDAYVDCVDAEPSTTAAATSAPATTAPATKSSSAATTTTTAATAAGTSSSGASDAGETSTAVGKASTSALTSSGPGNRTATATAPGGASTGFTTICPAATATGGGAGGCDDNGSGGSDSTGGARPPVVSGAAGSAAPFGALVLAVAALAM